MCKQPNPALFKFYRGLKHEIMLGSILPGMKS